MLLAKVDLWMRLCMSRLGYLNLVAKMHCAHPIKYEKCQSQLSPEYGRSSSIFNTESVEMIFQLSPLSCRVILRHVAEKYFRSKGKVMLPFYASCLVRHEYLCNMRKSCNSSKVWLLMIVAISGHHDFVFSFHCTSFPLLHHYHLVEYNSHRHFSCSWPYYRSLSSQPFPSQSETAPNQIMCVHYIDFRSNVWSKGLTQYRFGALTRRCQFVEMM